MKKIVLLLTLFVSAAQLANAQAYEGKGDQKLQISLNAQDGGTGISSSLDFGLGENMSLGVVATYLLNANDVNGQSARFQDRADLKARFNANIGNVLGLSPKMDVYPGLHLGTRNFGGHLGFRYFFTTGFGLFTEAAVPFARYDTDVIGRENYNNQFTFNIGASFNL